MKILFDANTGPTRPVFAGHEVVRADELGWQGKLALVPVLESLADPTANCGTNRQSLDFVHLGRS